MPRTPYRSSRRSIEQEPFVWLFLSGWRSSPLSLLVNPSTDFFVARLGAVAAFSPEIASHSLRWDNPREATRTIERRLQNLFNEVVIGNSHLSCGHRQKTRFCHAGHCIDFQNIGATSRSDTKIHASGSLASQHLISSPRQLTDVVNHFGRQRSGTEIPCPALLIF